MWSEMMEGAAEAQDSSSIAALMAERSKKIADELDPVVGVLYDEITYVMSFLGDNGRRKKLLLGCFAATVACISDMILVRDSRQSADARSARRIGVLWRKLYQSEQIFECDECLRCARDGEDPLDDHGHKRLGLFNCDLFPLPLENRDGFEQTVPALWGNAAGKRERKQIERWWETLRNATGYVANFCDMYEKRTEELIDMWEMNDSILETLEAAPSTLELPVALPVDAASGMHRCPQLSPGSPPFVTELEEGGSLEAQGVQVGDCLLSVCGNNVQEGGLDVSDVASLLAHHADDAKLAGTLVFGRHDAEQAVGIAELREKNEHAEGILLVRKACPPACACNGCGSRAREWRAERQRQNIAAAATAASSAAVGMASSLATSVIASPIKSTAAYTNAALKKGFGWARRRGGGKEEAREAERAPEPTARQTIEKQRATSRGTRRQALKKLAYDDETFSAIRRRLGIEGSELGMGTLVSDARANGEDMEFVRGFKTKWQCMRKDSKVSGYLFIFCGKNEVSGHIVFLPYTPVLAPKHTGRYVDEKELVLSIADLASVRLSTGKPSLRWSTSGLPQKPKFLAIMLNSGVKHELEFGQFTVPRRAVYRAMRRAAERNYRFLRKFEKLQFNDDELAQAHDRLLEEEKETLKMRDSKRRAETTAQERMRASSPQP